MINKFDSVSIRPTVSILIFDSDLDMFKLDTPNSLYNYLDTILFQALSRFLSYNETNKIEHYVRLFVRKPMYSQINHIRSRVYGRQI